MGKVISWIPTPVSKVAGYALQATPHIAGAIYTWVANKREQSKLHQYQGIDKETADTLAWQESAIQAASLIIPAALPFKSVTWRIASGAALNIPSGMLERGLASPVLEKAGYHEMAEHYRVLDMEAILLDGLIGSFCAALHTKQVRNFISKKAVDVTHSTQRVLGDLSDAIHDRVLHRHATRESSVGLHTSYEAYKAHMETFESAVDSVAKGEIPAFNDANLKTIKNNVIPDPAFQSHLPEVEPHHTTKPRSEPHVLEANIERQGIPAFSDIDEHASHRFAKLEQRSPELAQEVHTVVAEELNMSKTVKENSLYKVAIDCFLRTGGIR